MKELFKSLLAILIVIVSLGPLQSQNLIHGLVLDKESGFPIANVHITENRNLQTTISDSLGNFIIELSSFPAILNFSHLSYKSQNSLLQKPLQGVLRIFLTPSLVEIEEVFVFGNQIQHFFKDDLFSVKDFFFSNGKLWILGYANNNSLDAEIRALELSGDLIAKKKVPQKTELGLDAFGNIHQVQKDSVKQLYIVKDSIVVIACITNRKERETLHNLRAVVDSIAILREVNATGICNEYISFDYRDSSSQVFHEAYDKDLFESSNAALRYKHGRIPTYVFPPWPAGYDPMASYAFTEHSRKRLNTFTPISSQLFIQNDSIIIYQDRKPHFTIYNTKLKLIKEHNLETAPREKLLKLLKDLSSGKYYLLSAVGDDLFISQINPVQGEIFKTMQENTLRFVKNIKAYNDRIYFIHQTPLGFRTMNLYSIPFR